MTPGSGVVEAPKAPDRETVYTHGIEIMPSFPGGEATLARFPGENIRYPSLAAENSIAGTVFVQFVVDYEGNIRGVKVTGAQGRRAGRRGHPHGEAHAQVEAGRQNGMPV